jgi:hypothetical protein
MNVMPFIPKDDATLPDHYEITIMYLDGRSEEFELAHHVLGEKVFEFVTKDDVWSWVPLSGVKRIEFDKRFSQLIAAKVRSAKKKSLDEAKE